MLNRATYILLICSQLVTHQSMACWSGYSEEVIKSTSQVFAQANNDGKSYSVGNVKTLQKVCVSDKSEGQYAHIIYKDSKYPFKDKSGYISVSAFKGIRTEAVTPYCSSCSKEPDESFYVPVENGPEDIRTILEKVTWNPKSGLGEPLPYADDIMRNVKYGLALGAAGVRMCARAVSRILRASDLLPGGVGNINTSGGFNGEDGYNYLKNFGFYDDKSACNRPGVVLIYGQSKPGYGKKRGQPGFLWGDVVGHAEILGTDGKYYYYHGDSAPLNKILGDNRRPLKYCLVSRNGLNGKKL